MTREILFRGKNKYNGEWIEGDLRHIWSFDEYRLHIVDNSNKMNNSVCGVEVIPETVGRYTGLTDKSGRKIFEGDICCVEGPTRAKHGIISFSKGCCFFIEHDSFKDVTIIPAPLFTFKENNIEVIGNIHDNPDLIK